MAALCAPPSARKALIMYSAGNMPFNDSVCRLLKVNTTIIYIKLAIILHGYIIQLKWQKGI